MIDQASCLCVHRVDAGDDEQGHKERCVECGSVYRIYNGGEDWLEGESQ